MAVAYDTGTGLTDAAVTSLIKQQAQSMTFADLTQPAVCGTSTPPSPLTSWYQPAVGPGLIFIARSGQSSSPKYLQVSVVSHFEATTPMRLALISTSYYVPTATLATAHWS